MGDPPPVTRGRRIAAYAVHAYTASGVILAFLAAMEIASARPDPKLVFALFAAAVFVDASDGPFARRFDVKRNAPAIDGRTIDDIVDYLTFTFLPLLLVWKMGWVPEPGALWLAPALVASLFGFANTGAKDEEAGFFLGFPSYWNVAAFYAGIWHWMAGPWVNAAVLLALAVLTVAPVRFLYPNLAPRRWKMPLFVGALAWTVLAVLMAWDYPRAPAWMMWLSLVYPAFYTVLSLRLDPRRKAASAAR